ncbi:hypothetical protein [Mucisphaera calidilacus]|uniref:PEP-CTERM protein-sorting domain-containing protein n=1 Tax=Mucisphaera calidilacus TaxID=2527982 RepID=A0A518BWW6_9BACT|nr:hypothetical protein [Mucisphaera calidilacus]QDU71468.1 hypothetical protein Pan265_13180 [Mucisphaera calidilacus]
MADHATQTFLACTLMAALAAHAGAESFTFTEDFSSVVAPSDAMPSGWGELNGDFDVLTPAWHNGSQAAQLAAGGAGIQTSAYTGASDEGIGSAQWLDYSITATMGSGNWSDLFSSLWWGMGARVQSDGEMYGFRIQGGQGSNDNQAGIQLIRILPNGGGIQPLQTSQSFTSTLDAGETVEINFSVTTDPIDETIDLLANFRTNDFILKQTAVSIPFTSGQAIPEPGGVALIGKANTSGGRDFTWDDITVTGDAVEAGLPGDFNGSGDLDAEDIDLLYANLGDPAYDLNGDLVSDADDVIMLVTDPDFLDTFFGDANLDKQVDLLDLSSLASNFNNAAGWEGGSFNGDGVVDLLDLSILANGFGSSNAVPEPAGLSLLALAAIAGRRRTA